MSFQSTHITSLKKWLELHWEITTVEFLIDNLDVFSQPWQWEGTTGERIPPLPQNGHAQVHTHTQILYTGDAKQKMTPPPLICNAIVPLVW